MMIIGNIINDSFGLISKQLRFYCWHFRQSLDQRQRQELIELLYEQHFERLANKIKSLYQDTTADSRQQVGKLLFEQCLTGNRRHQLIQLIESQLVDVNVRLDNYGRTLLHRSAYNLDVDLVRILIQNGVNIRLRDYAGNTALHIAIQSYRNGAVIYGNGTDVVKNLTSIIELLLEADKNLQKEQYTRKRFKLHSGLQDTLDWASVESYYGIGLAEECTNTLPDSLQLNDHTQADSSNSSHRKYQCNLRDTNIYQDAQRSTKLFRKSETSALLLYESKERDVSAHRVQHQEQQPATLDPILLEDISSPLVDTKNAFGRTALHYCVLVVGEQHLAHFVKLLVSFGADPDLVDTRMKTPLYCLVKRSGISVVSQKCLAITHLLESGCDDLGLAIEPKSYFSESFIKNIEQNISNILLNKPDTPQELVFTRTIFKRVPSLKHIARLHLIRNHDERLKLGRQTKLILPKSVPNSLNIYVNRRILDQAELF